MKNTTLSGVTLISLFLIVGCIGEDKPDIKFLKYDEDYLSKPDFAKVEYKLPLNSIDLEKLTPKNIRLFDQEQVDQIYARLTAGPIPDGAFDGD